MSNPPQHPLSVPSNSSEREPSAAEGNQRSSDQRGEWRFDIDFRLNPNWLSNSNADAGGAPSSRPPLTSTVESLLSDWLRNFQRPLTSDSQHTPSSSSSATSPTSSASLPFDHSMRPTEVQIPVGHDAAHTYLPTADSQLLATRGLRSARHLQAPNSNDGPGDPLNQGYLPPPPPPPSSARRSSGPVVIDVLESGPSATAPSDESPTEAPSDRIPAEASTILALAERYFPFILILLFKGILDHASGITVFLGLIVTFGHANTLIRREVTKQGKRSLPLLIMIMMNLLICIFCLYYIFETDRLYPALVALSVDLPLSSIQSLLWLVLVTDFVCKFVTVILKCLVVMLPEHMLPFQKRGKYYMFIESSSQLYRCFLPIHPWLQYLFSAYEGTFKIFSLFLCLFYVICKAVDVSQRLLAWRIALKKFLQPVHYGTVPAEEELNEQFCPICHDSFNSPTKLSCGHIFCEDCVSNWLDRGERSCPMCRARVVDDTSWRDGTTSQFVQVF